MTRATKVPAEPQAQAADAEASGTVPIEEFTGDIIATTSGPQAATGDSDGIIDRLESKTPDPLGGVALPEVVVTDESGEPAQNVLIVTYNNGAAVEVPLKPGSIVEYVGGSFVRYVAADGTVHQGQLEVDFASVHIKD
jgi:hypothetical protein